MYEGVKPKQVTPVHGEHRNMQEQAKFAKEMKVPHTLQVENGDIIRIAPSNSPQIIDKAPSGRMYLDGFEFIQPWNSLVYHLTGRGAGSFDGDKERHEQWKKDMNASTLEFIRKWGQNVNHTPLMKPIVYPVYKKSVIINNSNPQLEEDLEPWINGGEDIIVEIIGN